MDPELQALRAERDALLQENGTMDDSSEDQELIALRRERDQLLAESSSPVIDEEPSIMRGLAKGTRNLAAAVGDIPDILHAPKNLYEMGKYGYRKAMADEGEEVAPPELSSFGLGDKIAKGIDTLSSGYTAPNDEDKLAETVTRSVGSMLGTYGLGSVAGIAKGVTKIPTLATTFARGEKALKFGNVPTLPNIAGTAAGAATMHEVLESEPDNYGKALLASTVTGSLGQLGADKAGKIATAAGRQAFMPKKLAGLKDIIQDIDPKKVERFKRLEVPIVSSDVGNSKTMKIGSNIAESSALVENELQKVRSEQPKAFLKALDIDPSKTKTKTDLGAEIEGTIKLAKQQVGERLQKVEEDALSKLAASGKSREVPMDSTINYLVDELTKERRPWQKKIFDNSDFKKQAITLLEEADISPSIIEQLRPGVEPYKIEQLKERGSLKGKIPYEELVELRKHIGEFPKWNTLKNSKEEKLFKQAYHKMKGDFDSHFETSKGDAKQLWQERNKEWSHYYNEMEPRLEQLLKASEKGEINTLNDLANELKLGGQKFSIITDAMSPEQAENFTKSFAYNMGLNKNKNWSPARFSRNFSSLEPEVQNVFLKKLTPAYRQKFKDAVGAGLDIADTYDWFNSSKTDINKNFRESIEGLGDATKRAAQGNFSAMKEKLMSWTMAYMASKYAFTDQKAIDALAAAKNIRNKYQPFNALNKIKALPGAPTKAIEAIQKKYASYLDQDRLSSSTKKSKLKKGLTRSAEMLASNAKKYEEDSES